MNNTLTVIIPIYNEEDNAEKSINLVLNRPETAQIIIIDDGSTDSTAQILKQFANNAKIKIISHETNQGKGAAIRSAIKYISSPYVIIQDADLEYSVEDYPNLIAPLIANSADVVFGARFLGNNSDTLIHQLGNKFLTGLSNLFTGFKLNDMETCYKVFRSDILKSLNLKSNHFEIEPEIVAQLAKIKDLRLIEIPISYHARNYSQGKKIGWKDGISAIYNIIKFR